MKYTIRLPKESGQIIPLMMVVQEIAKGFATRWGEQPFHRDTFREVERRWSVKIVEAAKRGELRVCDSDGFAIETITDDLTKAEDISDDDMEVMRKAHPECQIASGIWNFTGVDFGNRRKIEVTPVGLFITLMQLNEWAASRGDSFTIEEAPVDVMDINGMRCVIGSNGDTVIVDSGGMAPNEPKPAATITKHRIGARSHTLDAVIRLAAKTAVAPDDHQSVWAELVTLAESENKPAPLAGYSSDGIQYKGKTYEEKQEFDIYTKKNLRDKMARDKAR